MTANDDHFGEFKPHTKLKHTVLELYLEAWAFKLLMRKGAESRVWFVDAFAGRGRDDLGNSGSPTIACRTAMKVRGRMAVAPATASQRLGVYCIEQDPGHFAALAAHIAPFKTIEPALVHTRQGSLDDHLSDVLARTSGPLLAFLDPFGFKGLDASTYAPLLARPGSEIFALIPTEGSKRIAAAYQSDGNTHAVELERAMASLSLFPDDHAVHQATLRAKADAQSVRNEANRAKNLAMLTRALGSEVRALAVLEGDWESAPERTALAFRDALFDAGAKHVTFFPVSDLEGKPKHLFAHATKSGKGVLAMKESISAAIRDESLPVALRDRLRLDLGIDVARVVSAVRSSYAGQTVPWAKDAEGSAQAQLYVSTAAYPHHRESIEAALVKAGLLVRESRKRVLRVPPAD